jgi:hypothetical protein
MENRNWTYRDVDNPVTSGDILLNRANTFWHFISVAQPTTGP